MQNAMADTKSVDHVGTIQCQSAVVGLRRISSRATIRELNRFPSGAARRRPAHSARHGEQRPWPREFTVARTFAPLPGSGAEALYGGRWVPRQGRRL